MKRRKFLKGALVVGATPLVEKIQGVAGEAVQSEQGIPEEFHGTYQREELPLEVETIVMSVYAGERLIHRDVKRFPVVRMESGDNLVVTYTFDVSPAKEEAEE